MNVGRSNDGMVFNIVPANEPKGETDRISRDRPMNVNMIDINKMVTDLKTVKDQIIVDHLDKMSKWDLLSELQKLNDEPKPTSPEVVSSPASFAVLACGRQACEFKDSVFDMTLDLKIPGITLSCKYGNLDIEIWDGTKEGTHWIWHHRITNRYHNLVGGNEGRFSFSRLEEIQPIGSRDIVAIGQLKATYLNKSKELWKYTQTSRYKDNVVAKKELPMEPTVIQQA
jgi:hypothetical protein